MNRRIGSILSLMTCCAATLSCGEGGLSRASIIGVSGSIAEAAAAITGQEAILSTAASPGRHMGFDTSIYPGDRAMRAWRTGGAPYEWTGFYLPSPCHPDESWSGKRETIAEMGYGMAVLYVGQQTWGRTPGKPYYVPVTVTKRVKTRVGTGKKRRTVWKHVKRTVMRKAPPPGPKETCNADFVSASRGSKEALDAIARTEREGFPPGTTVFLDLERMDRVPDAMREYYRAWVRALLADGRYRPGIYVHTDNARTAYADVKQVFVDAGLREDPPFWIAKSAGFDLEKVPSEMGHSFAAVWQGVLDVEQTWNGHTILIDVNVAGKPSPSSGFATYLSAALTGSRIGD